MSSIPAPRSRERLPRPPPRRGAGAPRPARPFTATQRLLTDREQPPIGLPPGAVTGRAMPSDRPRSRPRGPVSQAASQRRGSRRPGWRPCRLPHPVKPGVVRERVGQRQEAAMPRRRLRGLETLRACALAMGALVPLRMRSVGGDCPGVTGNRAAGSRHLRRGALRLVRRGASAPRTRGPPRPAGYLARRPPAAPPAGPSARRSASGPTGPGCAYRY